jgi:hypothetical protein
LDAPACRNAGLCGTEQFEVVTSDRIFILFPEMFLLDQDIHVGRQHARTRPLRKQPDAPDVLLPAEDQFGFLFALRTLSPHGHYGRHQDGHHAQRHEQGRHRITVLTA